MPKRTIICLYPEPDAGQLITERIHAGIRRAASKQRCVVIYTDSPEEAIRLCGIHSERGVIILSSSRSECSRFAAMLGASGLHPLLANMELSSPAHRHSSVSPDFCAMAYHLTSALPETVKNPVFLGFNPDSCHDALRLRGTQAAACERGIRLFRIDYRGELSGIVDELLSQLDLYDCVICANDFTAQALLAKLPADCRLPLVSLGGTQRFGAHVLSTHIDYERVGVRLIETYLFLSKRGFADDLCLRIPAAPDGALPIPAPTGQAREPDYYRDETVSVIGRVERMMSTASREDLAILALLYENETYERIAGKTYMSVRTVKNHAKKLYELAGCSKKEEFVTLLRSTWKKVQDSVQILPKKRTCGDGQDIV